MHNRKEIDKIVRENLIAERDIKTEELAQWASHLEKKPISVRFIATVRKEIEDKMKDQVYLAGAMSVYNPGSYRILAIDRSRLLE